MRFTEKICSLIFSSAHLLFPPVLLFAEWKKTTFWTWVCLFTFCFFREDFTHKIWWIQWDENQLHFWQLSQKNVVYAVASRIVLLCNICHINDKGLHRGLISVKRAWIKNVLDICSHEGRNPTKSLKWPVSKSATFNTETKFEMIIKTHLFSNNLQNTQKKELQ